MNIETVVYYDKHFPSIWISKDKGYPQKIAQAFDARKVRALNADELREFVLNALDKSDANKKLIVFSQDVAPDTIVDSHSSSNTLRQYLDAGGSVLWIGDIPLYYKGERDKGVPTSIADVGGPVEILGVLPVFSVPKTSVTLTPLGRNIGLRTKWSGMRPIIQDKEIRILAKSECVLCIYYVDIEKRKGILRRTWDKVKTIQTVKAMEFEMSFGQMPAHESKRPNIHETHVNAWLKCFNSDFSNSGFYRIWDYPPTHLTQSMANELVDISQSIAKRIARASQMFWI